MKIAFDNDKYLKLQSENILKRVSTFDNKLYLEFGGKLFDDYHASRVLPGFLPDTKLKMLLTIKDNVEVVIAINSHDIQKNKIRNDLNINYQSEVLRLIDAFRASGLYVGSVCITQYEAVPQVEAFRTKLNNLGIKTYLHYEIKGYPHDVNKIISEEGFGKNEYIETQRKIVVVTAPGPGSGKMATCLSQLYHENKRGIKAGYAKYETFPIWNLPLKHPVNLAYEAATADLNDVNMVDPFHLDAYNTITVNYNRDVEIFPVLKSMFEAIYGSSPYKSPTDMGVNMAGFAICDDEAAKEASKNEIIRRYLNSLVDLRNGKIKQDAVDKIALLMRQLEVSVDDRPCVKAALDKRDKTNTVSMAMELPDGTIVDAKTSALLSAPAALLLNALKSLAGIKDSMMLISKSLIEPISEMKIKDLGNKNPRLHADEILVVLAISAQTNPLAEMAIKELPNLAFCQAHATVILPEVDLGVFKKLKIDVTTEAEFYAKKLYK
ncbi:MAG: DUF1846 domain-containing protein [Acholeplasmatales bacterium]|nr:DUF1846 domain-containing protein [Acholeplasmatales bacterium]